MRIKCSILFLLGTLFNGCTTFNYLGIQSKYYKEVSRFSEKKKFQFYDEKTKKTYDLLISEKPKKTRVLKLWLAYHKESNSTFLMTYYKKSLGLYNDEIIISYNVKEKKTDLVPPKKWKRSENLHLPNFKMTNNVGIYQTPENGSSSKVSMSFSMPVEKNYNLYLLKEKELSAILKNMSFINVQFKINGLLGIVKSKTFEVPVSHEELKKFLEQSKK